MRDLRTMVSLEEHISLMPYLKSKGENPGPIGTLLADDDAFMELIFDTYHVHLANFTMVRKAAAECLILVTDAARNRLCHGHKLTRRTRRIRP